jgi:diketogulonate reductase-like aldo/keto reductase
MKRIELSNGVMMPEIGFGTYLTTNENEETSKVMIDAITAGYRHFDTASFYKNERQLGKSIQISNVARKDFFITSKVNLDEMGYEKTKETFHASLSRIETDYIDLYLIHWPCLNGEPKDWKELDIETWKAIEELYEEGKIKAIGVSNFLVHHLENLLNNCTIKPMVNQIEFHPGYTQDETRKFCKRNNIVIEAWSPFGRGTVLNDTFLMSLAKRYHVSVSQLCLRFILQCDAVPLPKASMMQRMTQNLDVYGFEISDDDMKRILSMPEKGFSGYYPDKL